MYERFVDEVFDELADAAAYDDELFVDRGLEKDGFEGDPFEEYSDLEFGDWDAVEEETCRGFEIDSKNYIPWVQRSLNRNVGSLLPATGEISPEYRQGIKQFQIGRGIAPTGNVDENTQNKLIKANESDPTYVKWVQRALNAHGYGLVVDGVMGSNQSSTKKAIRDFQQKRVPDLCVDGYVGAKTELRLIRARRGWPPGHIEPPTEPKRSPKPEPPRPPRPLPRIVNCDTRVWGNVAYHWRTAVASVARARERLERLAHMAPRNRVIAWLDREQTWFGNYIPRNFERIVSTMRNIEKVLRSRRLRIRCNSKLLAYGRASPAISSITLGRDWMQDPRRHEKTQTLIHEAAHIAWIIPIAEQRKYGPECAKRLAKQNCFKATRNADNYGYYVLSHIAEYQDADYEQCLNKRGKLINFLPTRC